MTQSLLHFTRSLCLFIIVFSSSLVFAQTADKTEGCAPISIHFTAPAGSSTYFWEFDDGGSSTVQNPDHTFIQAKEHTVTFKESQGGNVVGSIMISIYPKPKPSFSADPAGGCVPLDVQFTNTSDVDANITVVNYNWVFGDGTGDNAIANPKHYFPSVNKFTIGFKLETDKEGCDTTAIFTDYINVTDPPGPVFSTIPFPPVACEPPLDLGFSNSTAPGNYTTTWDFGNGDTFTGLIPPNKNYTQNGQFPITITIKDEAGCEKSAGLTVGIGIPKPIVSIPNDTLCKGQIYTMQNNSAPGLYEWTFQDATPATSTQAKPNFRFDAVGSKTITMTLTSPDGLCVGDTTITVWVEDITASVAVDPEYSCSEPVLLSYTGTTDNGTIFQYGFGDGSTSTELSPSHLYIDKDTTTHSLEGEIKYSTVFTAISPAGCKATASVTTIINTPNALFVPDVIEGCAPLLVTFNDMSYSNENIVQWNWDFGDGTTVNATDGNDVQHSFAQAGEYPVTLIIVNSAGCTDTSYQQIIYVGESLMLDFTADQTEVCIGDEIAFSDLSNHPEIDAYHFHADGERLSHCFDDANPKWAFHEVGAQDVTLDVIYNGCHSTLTKTDFINVKGPLAKIAYRMECGQPFEYVFTSNSEGVDSLFWDFGDGNMAMMTSPITHTYAATGDYKVYLRAKNLTSGCPESIDSVTIFVRDIKADFSIPTQVCRGDDLMLDASNSTDVNGFCNKGYQWNSSERRPIVLGEAVLPFEFSFGENGDQWVELIVQDVNGCKDTLRQNTRVFKVDVTATPDKTLICVPNSVSFTSSVDNDTTLVIPIGTWDFGDMQSATGPSTTHQYTDPNAAVFNVTYTVKDILGCEGTVTVPISIYKPTSIITADPTLNICAGDSITFSATDFTDQGSHLNYNWNFGNGTSSTNQTEATGYPAAGAYDVTLNFTEDATGCAESATVEVNVQDYPTANFSTDVDNLINICYPVNIAFTDISTPITGMLTSNWNFGNGTTAIGSHVFSTYEKGTFDITQITSTPFGCKDTLVKTITTSGPEGDFEISAPVICLGDELTVTIDPADTVDVGSFYFDFGDGVEVHDQLTATHTYTFTTQQPIKLILISVDGECTFTISKTIDIIDINAAFTNANTTLTGCESEAFSFVNQSQGANQWNWDFGDGATSTLENPTHNYQGAGTYTVTLSVDNTAAGCHDEITQEITILPNVPVTATGGSLCSGDSLQISVNNPNDGDIYTWTPDLYASTPNESSTFVNPPVTTDFIVTADDGSGCIGYDTVTVFVVEPLQNINFDTTIFAGTTIDLPVQFNEPYVFAWNPTDGLSCLACSNPTVTPTDDITYTLSISDNAGCFNNTGVFIIRVFPENIDIPNAFTPNGDGTNDYFNVILSEDVAVLVDITGFRIYDRWGQTVYDNGDRDKGWDGRFKENELPADVYPFVVEATFINGKVKTIKGNVTLLR